MLQIDDWPFYSDAERQLVKRYTMYVYMYTVYTVRGHVYTWCMYLCVYVNSMHVFVGSVPRKHGSDQASDSLKVS